MGKKKTNDFWGRGKRGGANLESWGFEKRGRGGIVAKTTFCKKKDRSPANWGKKMGGTNNQGLLTKKTAKKIQEEKKRPPPPTKAPTRPKGEKKNPKDTETQGEKTKQKKGPVGEKRVGKPPKKRTILVWPVGWKLTNNKKGVDKERIGGKGGGVGPKGEKKEKQPNTTHQQTHGGAPPGDRGNGVTQKKWGKKKQREKKGKWAQSAEKGQIKARGWVQPTESGGEVEGGETKPFEKKPTQKSKGKGGKHQNVENKPGWFDTLDGKDHNFKGFFFSDKREKNRAPKGGGGKPKKNPWGKKAMKNNNGGKKNHQQNQREIVDSWWQGTAEEKLRAWSNTEHKEEPCTNEPILKTVGHTHKQQRKTGGGETFHPKRRPQSGWPTKKNN